MKRFVIILSIIGLSSINLWAQKNSPDEKSTVNKEYDENGNLIKYDSTYVWSWSSDSAMNLSLNKQFDFGKDFPDMFGEFFNDSVFENLSQQFGHGMPGFGGEEFFRQFHQNIPDSMMVHNFQFGNDSILNLQFGQGFPGSFDIKDLEELQKQFEQQFNMHSFRAPQFQTPEQQEEWEKLIKKQQKEKEELMKKWNQGSLNKL